MSELSGFVLWQRSSKVRGIPRHFLFVNLGGAYCGDIQYHNMLEGSGDLPSRKILTIQVLWDVIWCNLDAPINWQMPGFHIQQEIMEYLTKCSQLWLTGQQQQQHNVLTSNTLVANIILVELKEIRKLDICSFWCNHGFYINGHVSVSMHQGKCCESLCLSWNISTSSLFALC